MARINIPGTIAEAPSASHELLEAVNKQLGVVPNLFRLVSNSPAALSGYLALSGALGKGSLPVELSERIALAVAQVNECDYCLSAHTFLGKSVAKLDDTEIINSRRGFSNDPKADAAVRFATKVARERGRVLDSDLRLVREAGYNEAEIVEVVQHVALNIWTNYINIIADTEVDFPIVKANDLL